LDKFGKGLDHVMCHASFTTESSGK